MFWIIAAVLVVIAFIFIVPPMLRTSPRVNTALNSDARRQQNILIAKEQLDDLEQRFERGEMDDTAYQITREELESALFDDVEVAEQDVKTNVTKISLVSTIAIALLIPVIAVGMYTKLGNPVFNTSFSSKVAAKTELQKSIPKNADGTPDIDTMVSGLEKRLEANPDNAQGWYMLGRSYMVLKRYSQAAKAYEKAYKLEPESADVILSLADSLSMANNGDISGRPIELINKALKIEPNNLTALWLGGMAARQQQDPVTAIKHWKQALLQLKDPSEIQEVNSLIAEATKQLKPEQKAALKLDAPIASAPAVAPIPVAPIKATPKASNSVGVSVTVSLSEKFKNKVQPTDFVFIYAKAVTGPPMPLAAARKQVKDLPLEIILDDSMAMIPSMTMSGFSEWVIGARVSKNGQPIAQNGDLFAEKKPIKAGEKVSLEIDSVVVK